MFFLGRETGELAARPQRPSCQALTLRARSNAARSGFRVYWDGLALTGRYRLTGPGRPSKVERVPRERVAECGGQCFGVWLFFENSTGC